MCLSGIEYQVCQCRHSVKNQNQSYTMCACVGIDLDHHESFDNL